MKYSAAAASFVAFLIGFIFIAGRAHLAYSTVDTQAATQLKRWIAAEYTSYQLGRESLELEEKAIMLEHIRGLDFESINAAGPPGSMVFRVKLKPNPAQPPSAPLLRYYRLPHSLVTGWNNPPVKTNVLAYYLAFAGL